MSENTDTNSSQSPPPPTTTTTTTTTTASSGGGWGFSWSGFVGSVQKYTDQVTEQVQTLTEQVQNINIVDEIKKKSDQMVNIYKEDLKEFSNTLFSDTSTLVHTSVAQVKQFIDETDHVTDETGHSSPLPEDAKSPSSKLFKSLSFFTTDPSDIQDYEQWCKGFGDIESHSHDINTLLSGDESLKNLYLQYVPSKISHQQFWLKYFYKQYRINKEEERRQFILQQVSATQAKEEEEVGWDDDEDDSVNNNNNNQSKSEEEEKPNNNTPATITTTIDTNTSKPEEEKEDHNSDEELDQEIAQKYQQEQEQMKKELSESNLSEKFEKINSSSVKDHSSEEFEFEEFSSGGDSSNQKSNSPSEKKKVDLLPIGDEDDDYVDWE